MITDELVFQIGQEFGYEPTAEQRVAMQVFASFLTDRQAMAVMLMRGSAGTGKTSLAGAMVRMLQRVGQRVVLLAPTGRAAKVFELNAGLPAFTIHRKIYRQKSALADAFNLNDNLHHDTLFVVDEASMVANQGFDSMFGSGRLLDDLVEYVYGGRNCRLMLIGDKAQLPPVGETESPALSAQFLRGYGLVVHECDLNEVLRQSQQSGILCNATAVRQMLLYEGLTRLPRIRFAGFADIQRVPGDELIEQLNTSYSQVGIDETMVITRSNKRANIYNQGIRNSILGREELLTTGDMLMVVKNNYYWIEQSREDGNTPQRPAGTKIASKNETPAQKESTISFIANGDRVRVVRVRNNRELYGFHFADVWMQFPDYDGYELQATVLCDSLTSESPSLTREQSEALFSAVMADYEDIPHKADRIKKLREDRHFNALQVKYAYAVTCHKAQGGQWAHIYVDQGYMTDDMLTPDYIHWLYTAFTRASEKLFLVNWPKTQIDDR
jgi:tRNA A37 threonylcarbamoyladenosine biosynthesis protein TsaE